MMATFDGYELSPYELQREANIREKKKFLEEFLLSEQFKEGYEEYAVVPPAKKPRKARPKKQASENGAMVDPPVRRHSARLSLRKDEPVVEVKVPDKTPPCRTPKENSFGPIPGVDVGTHFTTRIEASHAGVHRPTVAGIHGNEGKGCYSIALSGGYEDDKDLGETFTYTGEGGRDLKGTKAKPKNLRTAAQSKDQVLTRGNLALANSVKFKRPVRVLRGYKLNSFYAPAEGYRYDGLYNVTSYKSEVGKSGFIVYKFRFERCQDQAPAPWVVSSQEGGSSPKIVYEGGPTTSTRGPPATYKAASVTSSNSSESLCTQATSTSAPEISETQSKLHQLTAASAQNRPQVSSVSSDPSN